MWEELEPEQAISEGDLNPRGMNEEDTKVCNGAAWESLSSSYRKSNAGNVVNRASFSTKCQTTEGDSNKLFSYKPGALEKAMDDCYANVVVSHLDGKPVDAWLLTEIDHWNFEKEKLVILTETSLLIVKYDFIKFAVCETKRINLCSISKIQIGDLTYPQKSLMKARDCGGVRIMFGDERQTGWLDRWNPMCRTIPFVTFMHHPLIYNKNEKETLAYNIDHMIENVKNGIEEARRRVGLKVQDFTVHEGPIMIETYAGLSSSIFNQSRIGFFKDRVGINF